MIGKNLRLFGAARSLELGSAEWLLEEWWERFPTEYDWLKQFRDMWE